MAKLFILIFFLTFSAQADNIVTNNCNKHEFKKFLVKIYDIYLCKEDNLALNYDNIYQHNFSLIIRYNIDIKKTKLISSTLSEISRYHKLNYKEKKYLKNKFTEIYPDILKSDVLEAKYNVKQGLQFFYNNKLAGKIINQDNATKFLDIWLYKHNHYKKMQQDLVN